jgi:Leucine-rich repeat (LRR) protein
LYCPYNNLTSIDVSQNTALLNLHCAYNQLTTLDVSQNIDLMELRCAGNQLQCLNVKNGNNINMWTMDAEYNAGLSCIEVDDVAWSTANWTVGSSIDAQMYFSTACGSPCAVGIDELNNSSKQLLKIVDLMGRETTYKPNMMLIYIYSDGTVEKVFKLEE